MPLGSRIDPSAAKPQTQPVQPQTKETSTVSEPLNESADFSLFQPEEPKHSFSDIILNKSTYDAIQDVLAIYEKRELLFDTWGLGTTHKQQNRAGINLYGAPGTGKSMAAHAIAKQLERQILTVDYSQIESKYVGETSKNLAAMFRYAKESGSGLLFLS